MTDETQLLEMLRSPKASVRYEACELLRVQPSISPSALSALEHTLEDPDSLVRDSASSALLVHKSKPIPPLVSDQPRPETKTCPYCAETIKYDAILCRYCGKPLPASSDVTLPTATPSTTSTPLIISVIVILVILILAVLCCTGNLFRGSNTTNSSSGSITDFSAWSCVEYDPPYTVVLINGSADVYGGVDEPKLSSVKGHITGGAVGIEASCSKPGASTYYRLRGVDWWGWVDSGKTTK